MKASLYSLALVASLVGANAYRAGFNAQATRGDGQCKTQSDWEQDFRAMKKISGSFTNLRVYASSDCDTLANAVPAAIATGGQILAGVWARDNNHFEAEKQALLSAVRRYGFGWVAAVSVGSEDLYRKDLSPSRLAEEIYDVRGMLSTVAGYTKDIQVGHVDTWTAWVDDANKEVIKACDFVGTDGYPYFQTTQPNSIDEANKLFWDSVERTRDTVNRVKPGTWVWVTETGWPTSGPVMNQATPSVGNAERYWKEVACTAFKSGHTFWYTLQDFNASPSFGVLDGNYSPKYNLAC